MIGVESHCTSQPADSAYRSAPLLKNSSLDELTRSAMLAACSPRIIRISSEGSASRNSVATSTIALAMISSWARRWGSTCRSIMASSIPCQRPGALLFLDQVHELRHRSIEFRRNRAVDHYGGIQRAGQRLVFDDR